MRAARVAEYLAKEIEWEGVNLLSVEGCRNLVEWCRDTGIDLEIRVWKGSCVVEAHDYVTENKTTKAECLELEHAIVLAVARQLGFDDSGVVS